MYQYMTDVGAKSVQGSFMADWAGRVIRREEVVDSTNRVARQWAREGAPHGAVVVARQQLAGRGRRGNRWVSPKDAGLWLSIVLRPRVASAVFPLLPLAAGLAVADACQQVTGAVPAIKWPNDVVLLGHKLCGILVEGESGAAVLGIGINVRQRAEDFPEDLRGKAGSLFMLTGHDVPMRALEVALLAQVQRRVDDLDFLPEYVTRCVTIGAAVRVLEPQMEYTGVAEGVDDTGALLVKTADGTLRRVLAGDVSVRGLMGYV